jgi:hypothetical protein
VLLWQIVQANSTFAMQHLPLHFLGQTVDLISEKRSCLCQKPNNSKHCLGSVCWYYFWFMGGDHFTTGYFDNFIIDFQINVIFF